MSSYNDSVKPIASESGMGENAQSSPLLSNQNVDFVAHETARQSMVSYFDPTRDLRLKTDGWDLNSFFSRPLRIHSGSWAVNNKYFFNGLDPANGVYFDPWSAYFSNTQVANRLTNFKLMRCTLNIRILITGNSFYYGRLMASYVPWATKDSVRYISDVSDVDYVTLSQYPNVVLSPTGSQTIDMELPFFCPTDLFDVPSRSWTGMGHLVLKSIGTLRCASTSATPVSISVFAWASQVEFGGLTAQDIASLSPQSDEYGLPPASRVASAIANVAGKLTDRPIIGRYARATQIGAKATSDIAALFGFSKPTIINRTIITRHTKDALSTYNGDDDVHKLTVDAKQEVTIDPSVTGIDFGDEMSITYLAMKPCYFTRFQWSTNYTVDRHLFSCAVDPCISRTMLSDASNGGFLVPPMAYVTYPFKYWRGGIKFKFDVVCSSFHKGRLKISYDPTASGTPLITEFNTVATMIVDIADKTSFEFCVPYTQNTAFRQHLNFAVPEINCFSSSSTAYTPIGASYVGNGGIYVTVVNPLSCATSTSGADIDVIVTVSACDDFAVANPTTWDICDMSFFSDPNIDSLYGSLEPQSLEIDSAIANDVAKVNTTDATDLIFMGETVRSIRQLLKRYIATYSFPLQPFAVGSVTCGLRFLLPAFPLECGIRYESAPATKIHGIIDDTSPTSILVLSSMSYLNYFSKLYAGRRGSIKLLIDTTLANMKPGQVTINRAYPTPISRYTLDLLPLTNANWNRNDYIENRRRYLTDTSGLAGAAIGTNAIEPVIAFEVPYSSNRRFKFARSTPIVTGLQDDNLAIDFHNGSSSTAFDLRDIIQIWTAAGEDYSLVFFVGTPPLFRFVNIN